MTAPFLHKSCLAFPADGGDPVIYWASAAGVYSWSDGDVANTLRSVYSSSLYNSSTPDGIGALKSFAGGRSPGEHLTLAVVNSNGSACSDGDWDTFSWNSDARRARHLAHCGDVLIQQAGGAWAVQGQAHGAYRVHMAANDGWRMYTTGAREWDGGTGTRVRLAQTPSGGGEQFDFSTVFQQVDVMDRYAKWPEDKLDYSGVGLDVGYDDGGYYVFSVNPLNFNEAGGSGNYFTHVTRNAGAKWESPFTQFAGCGVREPGQLWRSVGIEPTSNRLLKVARREVRTRVPVVSVLPTRANLCVRLHLRSQFHPTDPKFGVSCTHDIAGLVTEDGGSRWRLLTIGINTIYDVAFDPSQPNTIIAVTGNLHDWPHMWYGDVHVANGNVLVSYNRGRSFLRLGGESSSGCDGCADMKRQFLSVAYDAAADIVYAGSHSIGVARLRGALYGNDPTSWEWVQDGMYGEEAPVSSGLIVPQIEVDSVDGTVYCILSGNKNGAVITNQNRTGEVLIVAHGAWRIGLTSPSSPHHLFLTI